MLDTSVLPPTAAAVAFDWRPVLLTLELASVTTLVLLVLGTPLAWRLARSTSRLRPLLEAVIALPLVLPPTVLGFYLLLLLGPRGWIGLPWESLGGERLVFSFPGLVIGSVVYSLPFVVQPLVRAFESIGERPLEVASTLGAGPLDRFLTVVLPLARPAFLTAGVLGFAHTVGEFGIVLMIGGNVPGRTRVLSVALYDSVERLDYASAHGLALALLSFALLVLWLVHCLGRRDRRGSR